MILKYLASSGKFLLNSIVLNYTIQYMYSKIVHVVDIVVSAFQHWKNGCECDPCDIFSAFVTSAIRLSWFYCMCSSFVTRTDEPKTSVRAFKLCTCCKPCLPYLFHLWYSGDESQLFCSILWIRNSDGVASQFAKSKLIWIKCTCAYRRHE